MNPFKISLLFSFMLLLPMGFFFQQHKACNFALSGKSVFSATSDTQYDISDTFYNEDIDDIDLDDDTIDSILKVVFYSTCILLSFFIILNIKKQELLLSRVACFPYSSRIIFQRNFRI